MTPLPPLTRTERRPELQSSKTSKKKKRKIKLSEMSVVIHVKLVFLQEKKENYLTLSFWRSEASGGVVLSLHSLCLVKSWCSSFWVNKWVSGEKKQP